MSRDNVGDTETRWVIYTGLIIDCSRRNSGNINLCTTLLPHERSFQNNTSFNSNIGFWDLQMVGYEFNV